MERITIHGLKKSTGVQDWQLKLDCMDVHLEEISKHIKYYTAFATKMRLNPGEISEIKATQSSFSEKTDLVLKTWRSKTMACTYRHFVVICLDLEVGNVAKKMCELCADIPKSENSSGKREKPVVSSAEQSSDENPQNDNPPDVSPLSEQKLLCTTEQEYDHTPNEHQSNMPEEALYGSVRLSQLWGKKVLKVHFMNPEVLKKDGWKYGDDPLSQSQILSWVKSWNDNAVSYPKISLRPATKQDADIRVMLSPGITCWSFVGSDAQDPNHRGKPTMSLGLLKFTDEQKISYVLHEFGHALGLQHEHQRSDFWDILSQKDSRGRYQFIIGEEKMKKGTGCEMACKQHFRTNCDVPIDKKEQSEYDSNSIMHYWLDIKWLKSEYRDKRTRKYAKLTQKEKRVIDGVHQRDFSNGLLPDKPSNEDYKVLNEAYRKRQVNQEPHAGLNSPEPGPSIPVGGSWWTRIFFLLAVVVAFLAIFFYFFSR